jgi:hypothetical protein
VIRVFQLALLLAFIIPFGMAVRYGVESLSDNWRFFGFGIVVGIGISMLLDRWSDRIRQRAGSARGD